MDNVKELFIQSLIEVKDKELTKLKSEEEIEWEFSEKFENSMNKLIKKTITFNCQLGKPSEEVCLRQL